MFLNMVGSLKKQRVLQYKTRHNFSTKILWRRDCSREKLSNDMALEPLFESMEESVSKEKT